MNNKKYIALVVMVIIVTASFFFLSVLKNKSNEEFQQASVSVNTTFTAEHEQPRKLNRKELLALISIRFAHWDHWDLRTRERELGYIASYELPQEVAALLWDEVHKPNASIAIRRQAMIAISNQPVLPVDFTSRLLALAHDLSQENRVRDFALITLVQSSKKLSESDCQTISNELGAMVGGDDITLAESAIGLMSRGVFDFKTLTAGDDYFKNALAVLTDENKSEGFRAAAMIELTKFSTGEVVPIARNILKTADPTLPFLQATSLQALGKLGNSSDLAIIKQFKKHENKTISNAASAALALLQKSQSKPFAITLPQARSKASIAAEKAVTNGALSASKSSKLKRFSRVQNKNLIRKIHNP